MKKILIIEDDAFLKNLEIAKFTKEGFSVNSAMTYDEVDQLLTKEIPDIILLDLMLPEIDGFQMLKKFKEDPKMKDIPVIVFSNLSSDLEMNKAFDFGASEFMVKSNFTLSDVIEKMNSLIKS